MDRRRSLLKIAALRTEREHQQGVDCSQGYLQSPAAGLQAEGPRTLECLFKYAPSDKMQMIAGFGSSMMEVDVMSSANQIRFYCGGTFATAAIVLGNNYLAHISYDGTTAICYLNGTEAARFTVTGYKVADLFRTGSPSYAPKGSLVFCRHYNYALSGEEVATHYNNGDPARYVLPAAMKGLTPFDISGQNSYTWTGETDSIYSRSVLLGKICESGTTVSVKGTVSNYQSGAPFIYAGRSRADISAKDGDFTVMVTGLDAFDRVSYYGGPNGSDRRLTITIHSVEPVGCVAEYLPQNLVGQRDDKPIEITGDNSFTWTGVDDPNYAYNVRVSEYFTIDNWYKIRITVSNYEAGDSPFLKIATSGSYYLPDFKGDGVYETYAQAKGSPYRAVYLYAGQLGTDRRMTITVDSVEPIPDIALSWLDSAKQLPLNDEYLPPMLQSDGGYDLTASGMPEIIIK